MGCEEEVLKIKKKLDKMSSSNSVSTWGTLSLHYYKGFVFLQDQSQALDILKVLQSLPIDLQVSFVNFFSSKYFYALFIHYINFVFSYIDFDQNKNWNDCKCFTQIFKRWWSYFGIKTVDKKLEKICTR